ncbi:Hypothetical protein SRAE_1000028300 [Strongyloides ratti]|uniref:Uncharacterized protein n=1 Tax=Strongyloides ratti TaxID=34506 RepID=A0A090L1L1_STRRB|nr:Hypothetical protein SRAE_1000028300 [Strongyloides ratti]CEF62007.1 Hypothetical protein SRAE_1000028300 [Strongyloides ratti]
MILLLESRLICHLIFFLTIQIFQIYCGNDNIDFEQIFKQRLKGNKVDTCPCITLPNHSKCINYDPRYLAVTLEEAVLSFHDTTYVDTPPMTSDEITKFQCKTEECLQCVGIMNYILYYRHVIKSKNSLKFNFHIPFDDELNPSKCKKYRMTADIPIITPVKTLIDNIEPLVKKGKQFLNASNKESLLRSKFYISHKPNNLLQSINPNMSSTNKQSTAYVKSSHIIRDSQVRINQLLASVNVTIKKTPLNPNQNKSTFVSNVKSKLTIIHITSTTTTTTTTTRKQIVNEDIYNIKPPHILKYETLDEKVKIKTERSVPPITLHSSMEPMFPPNLHGPRIHGSTNYQPTSKNSIPQPLIGIRHKISCTPRGQPTTGTSTFINLCSFCWSWRRLPDGYFPKIINELVCDTDNHCLSGWGTCEQLHRSVDVFRQDPNGEWKQISLQIASCCVCKVQAGSDIHGLVMG